MSSLLSKFTPENLAFAERARTIRGDLVRDDPARLFEAVEPGLRVYAAFESYEANAFLCLHPDGAGWSIIEVDADYDHNGRPQGLYNFGGERLKSHLFEAWLSRPAPQPLTALFGQFVDGLVADDLERNPGPETAPVVMMLRIEGREGDALRTMAALGTWPHFDLAEVDPMTLRDAMSEAHGITIRYRIKKKSATEV